MDSQLFSLEESMKIPTKKTGLDVLTFCCELRSMMKFSVRGNGDMELHSRIEVNRH